MTNLFRWLRETGSDLAPALPGTKPYVPYVAPKSAHEGAAVQKFIARQGDVLIREVNAETHTKLQEVWESGAAKVIDRDNGRVVLAYGEVTGHAHAFHGTKVTMFLADGHAGARYLKVDEPSALTHEEHDAIEVPVGIYEVIRQREYDDTDELRRQRYVAD